MSEIVLTGGAVALVDEADLPIIAGRPWRVHSRGYAVAGRSVLMHRLLLGFPRGGIDHVNGNKLDNRRANLRPATPSQNLANSPGHRRRMRPYKGVCPQGPRWGATIMRGGTRHWLGTFDTASEAARAYDRASVAMDGPFARPNIREEIEG